MKNVLINIGLACGSIVLFLLAIEFGLRITGLQSAAPNPPKIYEQSNNPHISYELKPNLHKEKAYKATVTTDEYGFRINPDAIASNRPRRIAVLGDSITFGHGVHDNESLPAQLEALVPETQFINAAVPGYQLEQETTRYADEVAPFHPNGAILVFYWNDLNGEAPGILDGQGILREHDWTPSQHTCNPIRSGILGLLPGKCWLDTHSAFYKAFKKLMNLKASKHAQEEEREEEATKEPFANEQLALYLSDLRNTAAILPNTKWFVIWPDNYDHQIFRQKLVTAARQYGFTVIDLYDLFGNHVETLSWDTVHPSPESIRKAAEYIAPRVTENP